MMIRYQGVSMSYDGKEKVLDDLNFEIKEGEFSS